MILLDPPLIASWSDDFAGGALDRRYQFAGPVSGTATVAGGRLTLTLPPGPAGAFVSVAPLWPAWGTRIETSVILHAATVADAAARSHVGLILGAGADDSEFVGVVEGYGATHLVVWSRLENVTTVRYAGAMPTLPARLRIWRDGATVRHYIAAPDGSNETLLAEHSAFVATPAAGAMIVQSQDADVDVVGTFEDFTVDLPTRIDEASDVVMGCHLRQALRLRGRAIPEDLLAVVSGPVFDPETMGLCEIRSVSDAEALIVLPAYELPAMRWVWFFQGDLEGDASPIFAEGLPLRWSNEGYCILRALLPPKRYTEDPANPFNVRLAAIGAALDRIDAAARSLIDDELFADRALQLLATWENILGIPTNPMDSIAERRARCAARWRAAPRLTETYLNSLIDAVLPGGTLWATSDYETFGVLIFNGFVYEGAPNTLTANTAAELESLLNEAGPAWSRIDVGHAGFILDDSRLGRDFMESEE